VLKEPQEIQRQTAPNSDSGSATTPSPEPQAAVTEAQPPLAHQPPPADSAQQQLPLESSPPAPKPNGPIEPGSEENNYLATMGRNRALQKQMGEMEEQLRQLAQENLRLQRAIEQPRQSAPPSLASYLTPEDEKNFGPEILDVVQRGARQAMAPVLNRLEQENQELREEVQRNTRSATDRMLDEQVPNWREVNRNPRFHSWLLLPEPYSGIIRDRLLKDAAAAGESSRVVSFFQGFLREEAATGHIEPSPNPPPAQPPRVAAVPLSSLAAPGRDRPATGGIPTATPEKPTYTRADILHYSREYQRGRIPEADYQRLSADIAVASKEGRVIG
jgi:hypothetical protein